MLEGSDIPFGELRDRVSAGVLISTRRQIRRREHRPDIMMRPMTLLMRTAPELEGRVNANAISLLSCRALTSENQPRILRAQVTLTTVVATILCQ